LRRVFLEQLPQHRDEDVDRVGRQPLRVAKEGAFVRADGRVKRPVHLRATVNEVDERLRAHRKAEIFTISLARMPIRAARVLLPLVAALCAIGCAAAGSLFRQYEYEEDMYLALDGSAQLYVNSSLAALNALRGSSLSTDPSVAVDRSAVRAFF